MQKFRMNDNKEESEADALTAWNEIWKNDENILIIIVSSLSIESIDLLAKIIIKGKLKKAAADVEQQGRAQYFF